MAVIILQGYGLFPELRSQWENSPFKTPFYINDVNEGVKM